VSSDRRIESLSLGPVQTHVHKAIRWPLAERRLAALVETLTPQPPDAVHALSAASFRVARTIAKAFEAETVVQITSLADVRAIRRMGEHGADRYLATTQPLARMLIESLKLPDKWVELIRPGMRAATERACFSVPDRTPTLLSFARFERGGGAERLIGAAGLLRDRGREFMLFLLGEGPREAAVRRSIGERNLTSLVTFARPDGDRLEVLQSGDILVEPAAATAFRSVTLEALAAGVAVVTVADPVNDHLQAGETAVVCEKPDAELLADAIDGLLADPEKTRQMVDAGMDYVRVHHTVSAMAERTAETYRNLTFKRATFSLTE
jgi:glycosyltransferase involved in cell wall biosynthesis